MDVGAITALVTAAAGGAATEAGRGAWQSLLALLRRATGRADGVDEATGGAVVPAEPDPADPAAVRELAVRIAERAAADPDFARALRQWAAAHPQPRVVNSIGGSAQIHGPVVQAGEIKGDLNFG